MSAARTPAQLRKLTDPIALPPLGRDLKWVGPPTQVILGDFGNLDANPLLQLVRVADAPSGTAVDLWLSGAGPTVAPLVALVAAVKARALEVGLTSEGFRDTSRPPVRLWDEDNRVEVCARAYPNSFRVETWGEPAPPAAKRGRGAAAAPAVPSVSVRDLVPGSWVSVIVPLPEVYRFRDDPTCWSLSLKAVMAVVKPGGPDAEVHRAPPPPSRPRFVPWTQGGVAGYLTVSVSDTQADRLVPTFTPGPVPDGAVLTVAQAAAALRSGAVTAARTDAGEVAFRDRRADVCMMLGGFSPEGRPSFPRVALGVLDSREKLKAKGGTKRGKGPELPTDTSGVMLTLTDHDQAAVREWVEAEWAAVEAAGLAATWRRGKDEFLDLTKVALPERDPKSGLHPDGYYAQLEDDGTTWKTNPHTGKPYVQRPAVWAKFRSAPPPDGEFPTLWTRVWRVDPAAAEWAPEPAVAEDVVKGDRVAVVVTVAPMGDRSQLLRAVAAFIMPGFAPTDVAPDVPLGDLYA